MLALLLLNIFINAMKRGVQEGARVTQKVDYEDLQKDLIRPPDWAVKCQINVYNTEKCKVM